MTDSEYMHDRTPGRGGESPMMTSRCDDLLSRAARNTSMAGLQIFAPDGGSQSKLPFFKGRKVWETTGKANSSDP